MAARTQVTWSAAVRPTSVSASAKPIVAEHTSWEGAAKGCLPAGSFQSKRTANARLARSLERPAFQKGWVEPLHRRLAEEAEALSEAAAKDEARAESANKGQGGVRDRFGRKWDVRGTVLSKRRFSPRPTTTKEVLDQAARLAGVDPGEARPETPEMEWKPYDELEPPKQQYFQDLSDVAAKETAKQNAEEAARKAAEQAAKIAKRHWSNLQTSFNRQIKDKRKRREKLQGVIKDVTEVKQLAFFERGKNYVQRMLAAAEKYERDDLTYSYRTTFKDITKFGEVFESLETLLESSLEHNFVEERTELLAVLRSVSLRKSETRETDEQSIVCEGEGLEIEQMGPVAANLEQAYQELVQASKTRLQACVALAEEHYQRVMAEIRALRSVQDGAEKSIRAYDEEMTTLAGRIRSLGLLVREHEEQRRRVEKEFESRQQRLEQDHMNKTRMIMSLQKECKDSMLFAEELCSKIQSKLTSRFRANAHVMLQHHQRRRERELKRAVAHLDKRKKYLEKSIASLEPELKATEEKRAHAIQACQVYTVRQHLVAAKAMRIELLVRAAELGREPGEVTRDFGIKVEGCDEKVDIDWIPEKFLGVAQLLAQELSLQERWLRDRGQLWSYSRTTLELMDQPSLVMPNILEAELQKFLKQWALMEKVVHRFRTARVRRIGGVVRKAIAKLKQLGRIRRDMARRMAELLQEEEEMREQRILDLADESSIPIPTLKKCAANVSIVLKTCCLDIPDKHVEVMEAVKRHTLRSGGIIGQDVKNLAQVLQGMQGMVPVPEDHSEEIGEMSSIEDVLAAIEALRTAWANDIAPRWGTWHEFQGAKPMVMRITELIDDAFAVAEIVEACAYWFLSDDAKLVGVFNDLLETQESWIPPVALSVARRAGNLQAVVQLCGEALDEGTDTIISTVTNINKYLETMFELMNEDIHHGAELWQLRMQECLRMQAKIQVSSRSAFTWYYGAFFDHSGQAQPDGDSSATGSFNAEDWKAGSFFAGSFDRGEGASFSSSFGRHRATLLETDSSEAGGTAFSRGIQVLEGVVRSPELRETSVSGRVLASEFASLVHETLQRVLVGEPEALEVALMGMFFMENALRKGDVGIQLMNGTNSAFGAHFSLGAGSEEDMRDTVRSFLEAAAAAEREGGGEEGFLATFDQEFPSERAKLGDKEESDLPVAGLFFGNSRRMAGIWTELMVPGAAKSKGASSEAGPGAETSGKERETSTSIIQRPSKKTLRRTVGESLASKLGGNFLSSVESPRSSSQGLRNFFAGRKALLATQDFDPTSPVLLEMAALIAAAASSQAAAAAAAACAAAGCEAAAVGALDATEFATDCSFAASEAVQMEINNVFARGESGHTGDSESVCSMGAPSDQEAVGSLHGTLAEAFALSPAGADDEAENTVPSSPSSSTRPPTGTTERGGELMSTLGSTTAGCPSASRSPMLALVKSPSFLRPSAGSDREATTAARPAWRAFSAEGVDGEATDKEVTTTARSPSTSPSPKKAELEAAHKEGTTAARSPSTSPSSKKAELEAEHKEVTTAARSPSTSPTPKKMDREAVDKEVVREVFRALLAKLASSSEPPTAAPSSTTPIATQTTRKDGMQVKAKDQQHDAPTEGGTLLSNSNDIGDRKEQQQQQQQQQALRSVRQVGKALLAEPSKQGKLDDQKGTDGGNRSTSPPSPSHTRSTGARSSICVPVAEMMLDVQASQKDESTPTSPSSPTSPGSPSSKDMAGRRPRAGLVVPSIKDGTTSEAGQPVVSPTHRQPKRGLALAMAVVRGLNARVLEQKEKKPGNAKQVSRQDSNEPSSSSATSGRAAFGSEMISGVKVASSPASVSSSVGQTPSVQPVGISGVSVGVSAEKAHGPSDLMSPRMAWQVASQKSPALPKNTEPQGSARRASTVPPPSTIPEELQLAQEPVKRKSFESMLSVSDRGSLAQLPSSWVTAPNQPTTDLALPLPLPLPLPLQGQGQAQNQGVRFDVPDLPEESFSGRARKTHVNSVLDVLQNKKPSFGALERALEIAGEESGTSGAEQTSDGAETSNESTPASPRLTPRQTLHLANKAQIGLKKLRKLQTLRRLRDEHEAKEKQQAEVVAVADDEDAVEPAATEDAAAAKAAESEDIAKEPAKGVDGAGKPRRQLRKLPTGHPTRDQPRFTSVNLIVEKMQQAQANRSLQLAESHEPPPELDVRGLLLNSVEPLMVQKLLQDDTESLPTDVPDDDLVSIMGSEVVEYVKRESFASLSIDPARVAAWREKIAAKQKKDALFSTKALRPSAVLPQSLVNRNMNLDPNGGKDGVGGAFRQQEEGTDSDESQDGEKKKMSGHIPFGLTAPPAADSKASRGRQRWDKIIRNDKQWNLRSNLQKVVKEGELSWTKELVRKSVAATAVANYEQPAWLAELAGSSGDYHESSVSGQKRPKRRRGQDGVVGSEVDPYIGHRSFAGAPVTRGRAATEGAFAVANSDWGVMALAADLGLGLAVSQNAAAERSQGIARAGGLGLGLGFGEMAAEYRNHGVEVGFVMPGDNPRVVGTPGTRCVGFGKELSGDSAAAGKVLSGGPSAVWFPPVMSHKSPRASPTLRRSRYTPSESDLLSSAGGHSSCSSTGTSAMGGPLEKRRRKQVLYHDRI